MPKKEQAGKLPPGLFFLDVGVAFRHLLDVARSKVRRITPGEALRQPGEEEAHVCQCQCPVLFQLRFLGKKYREIDHVVVGQRRKR